MLTTVRWSVFVGTEQVEPPTGVMGVVKLEPTVFQVTLYGFEIPEIVIVSPELEAKLEDEIRARPTVSVKV